MLLKILLFLGLLLLLLIIGGIVIGYVISAPRYAGPVSDHFDGTDFFTPGAPSPKGFREVIGWQMNRERTQPWGRFTATSPGPAPPTRVPAGPVAVPPLRPVRRYDTGRDDPAVRVTFVNHSTVLLQFDGLNVLTDPIYENRVSPFQFAGPARNSPPGIRFDDLPPIDVLLLSHNHWDHLEIGTVAKLCARDQPRVYCPLGVRAFLEQHGCRNVTEMDWRQSVEYTPSTTIHCVPAQHFSGRGLFDRNGTLWAGYVIENGAVGKLYFAGDSGYGPHFRAIGEQFGPLQLALIPIGAYKPNWFMSPVHCNPAEAVRIHADVRSEQSVAIHFGTFPLADDGETEPVDDLRKALAETGIPPDRFRALKTGESLTLDQKK